MTRLRTPEDHDRFKLALTPVDQAMWASEQKWGVGRLERLISQPTLQAYKRGWDQYRTAIEDSDPDALAVIGPKMIAALTFMDHEATAAGHQPGARYVGSSDGRRNYAMRRALVRGSLGRHPCRQR